MAAAITQNDNPNEIKQFQLNLDAQCVLFCSLFLALFLIMNHSENYLKALTKKKLQKKNELTMHRQNGPDKTKQNQKRREKKRNTLTS